MSLTIAMQIGGAYCIPDCRVDILLTWALSKRSFWLYWFPYWVRCYGTSHFVFFEKHVRITTNRIPTDLLLLPLYGIRAHS